MDWKTALLNPETMKIFGYTIAYPVIVSFTALKLAKFHFEKDIKKQYLLAKDKVARDIINQVCIMLKFMWEMVNIDNWIARGDKNPELPQRRQQAYADFHKAIIDSYSLFGIVGLYYGSSIVDEIAQLQSDLNDMVNTDNFVTFDEWDKFRRKSLLPILNKVYKELKYTVFDRPVWDLF